MALHTYLISEYDHQWQRRLFEALGQWLEKRYGQGPEECILIGNYPIEGVELEALLITAEGVRTVAFKDWGGKIRACEQGDWRAEGLIIEGGSGRKSPFGEIRLKRNRAARGLSRLLGVESARVGGAILFGREAEIDLGGLSEGVREWLVVCDMSGMEQLLPGGGGATIPEEVIGSIPQRLGLATMGNGGGVAQVANAGYEPETSTYFYDEIEQALRMRPDYRKVYGALSQTFRRCLNQKTEATRINFGGDFAKTDFLLKEHGAPRPLVRAINDTRVRFRKRHELKEEEMEQYCLYDVRNLCRFVELLYRLPIPTQLAALFPTKELTAQRSTLIGECLRVIVERWDEEMVYVHSDEAEGEVQRRVCYAHGNKLYNYDWSYLKELLHEGAQLNLVRPREAEGVIYPELIIYEPDYLVNISTVAHCFTAYAESPLVDLIKKLEPASSSQPLVLGNLAGQLLDEAIHQLPSTHSYGESVRSFFKENAFNMLTAVINSATFHEEAKKQKQNIERAIRVTLPKELNSFNPKEGIVEPSFFSEMLGLQGRMDFLQMDFRVLMEQKSGKGEFPYDNYVKPRQTEEHYVQMLLYMAIVRYNYREIYEQNQELQAFLLYSKYQESLLALGFAPELLFRAIRIRNWLAWSELLYTQPAGFRRLDDLTPELLNKKQLNNRLWGDYIRPQIAAILDPIRQASELERAYYYRFLTFIANEHAMSKLGNKTKESAGFASTWLDSLEEKRAAGNIYDGLTLEWPQLETTGCIETVELRFAETDDNDMSNFRVGDIVILYPYAKGSEPDARKTMVFRCTISEIGTERIRLTLRATQSDNRVFVGQAGKLWAIEHDFMESSYSSLYRGMQAFLSAPKRRRDLLLLQREPEVDEQTELKGEYGDFDELALRVKRAKELFLIIGPPGTGKTSHGLLDIVKEDLEEKEASILLLSYTNRAVDEICSTLHGEGIDFIRIGGRFSCSDEYRDKLLSAKVEECGDLEALRALIGRTRVFVGTTTALNSNIFLFQLKAFSLAVVDEASQILEPHLIGLLSACKEGQPAIRKFVLIGDHKQLPAVVQQKQETSMVRDVMLNEILLTDCRLSLFERLLIRYANNPAVTFMLRKQGRMHPDIALFPNHAFYNNRLEAVPVEHQMEELELVARSDNGIEALLQTRRICFIDADLPEESPSDKVNLTEAEMIAALVVKIYELESEKGFDVNATVGVIVPYRNQIATVRKAIDAYGIGLLHDITIDTVERYQGSQRKYIIYGFTVQRYYQLNFLTNNVFEDPIDGCIVDRKLNVAMTRAREHLVMVGNAELLSNNFTFFKLIEFVRSRRSFFQVKKADFVAGNFVVPRYEVEELGVSDDTFVLSEKFREVYDGLVMEPVKRLSGQEWPRMVMGHDMETNLEAIGYGRINFSNQLRMIDEKEMTPEQQVLVYCYYIMRQHYCSGRNLYSSFGEWLVPMMQSVEGRVQMVDVGCGPATCGVAFAELYGAVAPNMVYTGIDTSVEMKRMGQRMMEAVGDGKLHFQFKESLAELGAQFWEDCSELPSLVIFNFSYFFSNVNQRDTERLAREIHRLMIKNPLNRYVFFVQHSEHDHKLESFKVFKRIIMPAVHIVKEERSTFAYRLNHEERRLGFWYDVWES